MAQLTSQDIDDIYAEWMRQMSDAREEISISKSDVRSMIVGIDGFFSDNAAAANASIPQPARSAVSQSGKGRASTLIIAKRWIRGA